MTTDIRIGVGEVIEVESSNIASIALRDMDAVGLCQLRVTFSSGAAYDYHDVDAEDVDEFVSAESKGSYLRKVIIPKYEVTKVEEDGAQEVRSEAAGVVEAPEVSQEDGVEADEADAE